MADDGTARRNGAGGVEKRMLNVESIDVYVLLPLLPYWRGKLHPREIQLGLHGVVVCPR